MSRRALIPILAVTLALSYVPVLSPASAFAGEQWVTKAITAGGADKYALDVSGDRLAWAEVAPVAAPFRTGGRIFTWKAGQAAPTGLSAGTATFGDAPRVSGDRVSWAGPWAFLFEPVRHIEAAVYTWTPSGGRSVVATGDVVDVDADGDRVAWRTDADSTALSLHRFALFTWRAGNGIAQLDLHFDGPPAVSGDRVAWWDGDASGGAIHTWVKGMSAPVAASGFIPMAGGFGPNYQIPVRLSGDRIVWTARGASGDDIFTWTPSAGVVRVTGDGGTKSVPEVSGDRIVWSAAAGKRSDIFTWSPSAGTLRLRGDAKSNAGPRIWGDRIVWAGGPAGRRQIYTWTPRTNTTRVTHGRNDNGEPVVSGALLAWRSRAPGGSYQIVTATVRKPHRRAVPKPR